MVFQPAAGAHGEFTGLLLITAYHESRGDSKTDEDPRPGFRPWYQPGQRGDGRIHGGQLSCPDRTAVWIWRKFREAADDEMAGIMLTNPNTLGMFEKKILEITEVDTRLWRPLLL